MVKRENEEVEKHGAEEVGSKWIQRRSEIRRGYWFGSLVTNIYWT